MLGSRLDGSLSTSAAVPAVIEVPVGDFRLVLPDGWFVSERVRQVPGFDRPGVVALRGASADVLLAQLPTESYALLPKGLIAKLSGAVPPPRRANAGARVVAVFERLPGVADGKRVDAHIMPTTAGIATALCVTDSPPVRDGLEDCATALERLDLGGATALEPRPGLAVDLALPRIVAALDQVRVPARRALAASNRPVGRLRATRRLREAHLAAAGRLEPLADTRADVRLVSRLRSAGGSYSELGTASAARRPQAATRAGRQVQQAEAAVDVLLARRPVAPGPTGSD